MHANIVAVSTEGIQATLPEARLEIIFNAYTFEAIRTYVSKHACMYVCMYGGIISRQC